MLKPSRAIPFPKTSFGLNNGPATFQRTVNIIFADVPHELVYIKPNFEYYYS